MLNVDLCLYTKLFVGCTDGDLRLVNGTTGRDGTVEICYDNLWGLVGTTGWGVNDATVVCRQANLMTDSKCVSTISHFYCTLIDPTPIMNAYNPMKTIHLSSVYCTGRENSLSECTVYKLSLNDPSSNNQPVVGVYCPLPNVTSSSSMSQNSASAGGVFGTVSTTSTTSYNALYLITGVFTVLIIIGIGSVVW